MFYLRRAAVFAAALMLCCSAARALEVSSFEVDKNGYAQIGFCGKFKIINTELIPSKTGWKLEIPLDWGGYQNIIINSKDLSEKIEKCFKGECPLAKKVCGPELRLAYAKKAGEKSALVKIEFDKELTAVFFLGKAVRGKKTFYRLNTASDFKFIDEDYRKKVKDFIVKQAGKLL